MSDERKTSKEHVPWQKRLLHAAIGIGVAVIVIIFAQTTFYDILELKLLDQRYVVRGPIYMDPNVVTIDIDAETLDSEGRFQDWTRDKHTKIIRMVHELGARMIGFDVYFVERSSRILKIEDVEELEVSPGQDLTHLFRDYDREMYEAIKATGNVVLGYTLNDNEMLNPEQVTEGIKLLERFYKEFPEWEQSDLESYKNMELPITEFIGVAEGCGLAQTVEDVDGSVRHYPLVMVHEGKIIPSLGLMMFCNYIGISVKDIDVIPGERLDIPEGTTRNGRKIKVTVPINDMGQMIVNWSGDYWDDNFNHMKHIVISYYYEDRKRNLLAAAMKEVFLDMPEARQDIDLLVAEMEKKGFEADELMQEIYSWIDTAVDIEEALDSGYEFVQDEVPEEIYELAGELRTNAGMLAFLRENPDATFEDYQTVNTDATAIADRPNFLYLQYLRRHNGDVGPSDHPLKFFPLEVSGRLITDDDFKDKVFFYGLTAAGTHDLNPMPYNSRYPMLGLHANAFNTILTSNFLQKLPPQGNLLIMLCMGILMGFVVPRLKPLFGAILMVGLTGGYLVLAQFLFQQYGWWVDILGPVMVLVIAYLFITVYNFFIEGKEKKMIRGVFSRYVTKSVVDELIKNPDMIKLGGERKILTVFFSDLAGFSTVSEQLSPEDLVLLLNEYLTAMTNIVLQYDGMIDKYEGDLIMAVFGTPVPLDDHATRACFVSLDMQDDLRKLRVKWKEEGKPLLRARIGMNTGPMIAGNMGSSARLDYTVMGDSVNLGSRLEGANKAYGTNIMISGSTQELVKNDVETRFLDSLQVKGKQQPVKVFEVLARKDNGLSEDKKRVIEVYNEGMEAYLAQEWEKGIKHFEDALTIDGKDGPSKVYLERCRQYQIDPPSSDWDGVYVMTTK